MRVALYDEHKNRKAYTVHRLAAKEHLPNPENKKCVNHIDGNKLNNRINNLEWATYKENTDHAFHHGLRKGRPGEKNHNTKLSNNQVLEIFNSKLKIKELCFLYGLNYYTVWSIKNGARWGKITNMSYFPKKK